MKKKLLLSFTLFFILGTSFAQRIVYVDTEYILGKLPQYDEALAQLESFTQEWQDEIAGKEQELMTMKTEFQQKVPLMPENIKMEEENKITTAEAGLLELKRKRFGVNGDLFKKQQDLIRPIQDQIFNTVKSVAEKRGVDFVLDKATGVSILYVKPSFDMSDEVLSQLNNTLNND